VEYAPKYFTVLTTKDVPNKELMKMTTHHQDGSITITWDVTTHTEYPTIHLADIPTLLRYSNFLRTVPHPAELFTDMHQQLFFTACRPSGSSYAVCRAPADMRDAHDAEMENFFKNCWSMSDKTIDIDHAMPLVILFHTPPVQENRYLRMVYNPLSTRLCQYAGYHDGRILLSRYIQIPALLIFSSSSSDILLLQLLCDLKCQHWYDAVNGDMIIYWESANSYSMVYEMRFDDSPSRQLQVITVHTAQGESARFTPTTPEDPYVFTGTSFGLGYNKIDIFYYLSVMHNE